MLTYHSTGNNGGVGGSQDVGCVQYWLEAGI